MLNYSLEILGFLRTLLLFEFTFGDRRFEGLEFREFLFDLCNRRSVTVTIKPVASLRDEGFEFFALVVTGCSVEKRIFQVVTATVGECLKFVACFFQGATVVVKGIEALYSRLNVSFSLTMFPLFE